jgi:7,8-dihydropterin-6-yl-methyl-4-(beta-D-ribofuranosyl)aminobenzene 5'-phosphate synthase
MMKQLDSLQVTVVAEDSVGYETPFLGQHGISLLIEASGNGRVLRILMDVAQHPDALLSNMGLMDIDPASIDMIVLTHCHYDHTQGLADIVRATGKTDLPVIAHPDLFRVHFITDPFFRYIGVPEKDSLENIEEAGGKLCLVSDPLELMPGIVTSGEVQRKTEYEDVGMALKTVCDGKVVQDQVLDDVSLFASVRDKGLVIMTGCSHSGIVNITHQAVEHTGINTIEAVIGGFHLIEADNKKIEKTVKGLNEMDIRSMRAGHCTGFNAQMELFRVFGQRFAPMRTGDIYSF